MLKKSLGIIVIISTICLVYATVTYNFVTDRTRDDLPHPETLGSTKYRGVLVMPNINVTLTNITVHPLVTATECSVWKADHSVTYTTATITNGVCSWAPYVMNLTAGIVYDLEVRNPTGNWNNQYEGGAGQFPLARTNLNFTAMSFFESSWNSQTAETDSITNVTTMTSSGSADTCTYSGSGNWTILCSDNCSISSSDIKGNNFTLSGIGITTNFRNIKNYNYGWITGGCKVYN